MKLISLYIENFGGLHRFSLDFGEGITSILQPNGFGKTTLAEFIRAMFYGFPRKSKTLDRSRRQKYTPWNGGQFGGNLVFEQEGKHYRIERTFGANPKADVFAVIDLESGRKTTRFPDEIGQELFGLDADSFERSVYLPQLQERGTFATASIQAKLSDLVEDGSDVAGFDKAMAELRAQRSNLIPYRGSGGAVSETAAAITGLQLRLDTLQRKEAQLRKAQEDAAQARRNVEKVKELLAETSEQLQTALRLDADRLRRLQYMQLCGRYSKAEAVIRECRKKYPAGLPREEALRRAELNAERLRQQEENPRAEEAVPTQEQLESCRRLCREHETMQARLYALQLRLEETAGKHALHPEVPPLSGTAVAATVCGAAGGVTGTVLMLFLQRLYGIVILGAGILLLAAGIVTLLIQSRKRQAMRNAFYRQRQAAEDGLTILRQQVDTAKGTAEKYSRQLELAFDRFGLPAQSGQYGTALTELEHRYAHAQARTKEIQTAKEELQSFFTGLGVSHMQDVHKALLQLRADMQALQTAAALSQSLKEQIAAMEEAGGDILFTEDFPMRDPRYFRQEEGKLRMELTAETTRMLQAEQEALGLREELSVLPAMREELEQARQKLAEDREKVRILDATMAFLQQARENLATSYMGTIRSRFGYYLSMLGGADEKYFLDSDLRIQLERQGQARELAYFSAGQADLLQLCMRLALSDALFRNQQMFLILDDPFVNLDDAHMEQACLLLRRLACQRQILYFSCHASRTV